MMLNSQQLSLTIMWTLLLFLVSSISLTTSKPLTFGEEDIKSMIPAGLPGSDSELDEALLGPVTKVDPEKLPDNYENSASHVEHIGDNDVEVNTNISHHKTNHSECTKVLETRAVEGDNEKGFKKFYAEFKFDKPEDGEGDTEEDSEEVKKDKKMVKELLEVLMDGNKEMEGLFDGIL